MLEHIDTLLKVHSALDTKSEKLYDKLKAEEEHLDWRLKAPEFQIAEWVIRSKKDKAKDIVTTQLSYGNLKNLLPLNEGDHFLWKEVVLPNNDVYRLYIENPINGYSHDLILTSVPDNTNVVVIARCPIENYNWHELYRFRDDNFDVLIHFFKDILKEKACFTDDIVEATNEYIKLKASEEERLMVTQFALDEVRREMVRIEKEIAQSLLPSFLAISTFVLHLLNKAELLQTNETTKKIDEFIIGVSPFRGFKLKLDLGRLERSIIALKVEDIKTFDNLNEVLNLYSTADIGSLSIVEYHDYESSNSRRYHINLKDWDVPPLSFPEDMTEIRTILQHIGLL